MTDTERRDECNERGIDALEGARQEAAYLRERLQQTTQELATLRRVHQVVQGELNLARQRARRPWANEEALEELVLQMIDGMETLAKYCQALPPHELGPRLARWSAAIDRARGRNPVMRPLGLVEAAAGSAEVGRAKERWPCD